MSRARQMLLLAVLGVLGCNNNNNSAVSFAFKAPQQFDFACFGQYVDTGTNPALDGTWEVLPRSCCTITDLSSSDPAAQARIECLGEGPTLRKAPVLHALVTQSTRGEVAAVDLVANRVLDSDRQVPGFTFLDIGGLPTAIVVPPALKGDETIGPPFFYVASSEQNEVRAIPTCRFRSGARCGPDRAQSNADPAYPDRLRVALPGAPSDMILGPDHSLLVTIPAFTGVDGVTSGVILRIELPQDGVTADAFALRTDTRLPVGWEPYGVPPVDDSAMADPVAETSEYLSSCGLSVDYKPGSFTLPIAPRADTKAVAEPERMRFDEESGLLFVSDRSSPGLHVFRPEGAVMTSLGSLQTGQPLTDFVITPPVPTSSINGLALVAATTPAEDPTTKRYLYGIDIDGRVAVFDFVADEAGTELPTLTPLLVPDPDLLVARYADRIETFQPAQSLAVIDTRTRSDYVCGEESIDALRLQRADLRKKTKPLSVDDARTLARVEDRIAIFEDSATEQVRGVFVAVTSKAGRLSLIDVHDLDSACRAQRYCCVSDGNGTGVNGVPNNCLSNDAAAEQALKAPRNPDALASLLVRRHAARRRSVGKQGAELGTTSLVEAQDCDPNDASASVELLDRVCTPADNYNQLADTWRVEYQASLPSSYMAYAHWETVPGQDRQLTLVAPKATNLCSRGVEVGDLVAVQSQAPEGLRGTTCPDPSADQAPLFKVLEAYTDHLLVEPFYTNQDEVDPMLVPDAQRESVRDALRCYPDYVGADLRSGEFLVLGERTGTYLHRIITGLDGRCITDTTLDESLNSRVRRGLIQPNTPQGQAKPPQVERDVFRNPYVSFALTEAAASVDPETRETAITVTRASVPFYLDTVASTDQVTTAQPSALQYMAETGYLFLLDTAGQGLRRYTMRPFERDVTPIR